MKRISFALLLLLASVRAIAQTPPPCASSIACVRWSASPGWTDGTSFAAGTVVNYAVQLVQKDGAIIRQLATTTSLNVTIPGLPAGERCFAVIVLVDGARPSELSNIACKMIRFAGPTDGSIEAPTDGAIEEPIF